MGSRRRRSIRIGPVDLSAIKKPVWDKEIEHQEDELVMTRCTSALRLMLGGFMHKRVIFIVPPANPSALDWNEHECENDIRD